MDHFTELQDLVKMAKEYSENDKLKESKNTYLDAASLSLKISKEKHDVEKLTFENLTKELILQARGIQDEINLKKDGGLPSTPIHDPTKSSIPGSQQPKTSIPTEQVQTLAPVVEEKDVKIKQLIIILEGGLPLLSEQFNQILTNTQDKINEILFSGAITAVNQLMMEVLERPIRTISFDDGVLIIHNELKLYFALFVDKHNNFIEQKLKDFAEKFISKFETELKNTIAMGRILSDQPIVMNYVKTYFGRYL